MASSSCSLTDEIQCGICLDVFTDPVSTSCGHTFCKVCIEACWNNGQIYDCPLCKKEFETMPELKINIEFQNIVDHILRMKMLKNTHKSNVLCDICCGNKLRAVQSCLQCVASFCETHLDNHKTSPRRMKHKLISPVENLEDYICDNHEKPLEMFCRDDKTFLCLFCTETEHKTHDTVSIEQEGSCMKDQLGENIVDIEMMIMKRHEKIKQMQELAKINKKTSERYKACSVELFTTLMRSIERCQSELLDLLEEKQKAAEDQAEGLITELEQEIAALKRRDTELQQLLHTEDHLHLLRAYPSVCWPLQVKSWTNISINADLNTENLKKTITCLQEEVQKELKKFFEITQPSVIQGFNFSTMSSKTSASALEKKTTEPNLAKEIFIFNSTNTDSVFKYSLPIHRGKSSPSIKTQQDILTDVSETSSDLKEGTIYFTLGKMDKSTHFQRNAIKINKVTFPSFAVDLNTMQTLYAVDVILDPNTSYPKLLLSKDGKQVSYEETWRDVPNNPERFDCSACVLGKDGFSCGRFYFEVQVGDKPEWDIGVARQSINKKGKITMCPENGFWSIWRRGGHEYKANDTHPISLSLNQNPHKVGVFVDYEEGSVSFYDVENKCLIYCFTSQCFTEKLYPFLSPCNKRGGVNTKPLVISRFNY